MIPYTYGTGIFNIKELVGNSIVSFFVDLLQGAVNWFGGQLANVMQSSLDVVNLPIVQSGIAYTQALALALITVKAITEGIQTYLFYQSGDPDADPTGLLVRVAQSIAVIGSLPWIIQETFKFGGKVARDVANLKGVSSNINNLEFIFRQLGLGPILEDNPTTELAIVLIILGISMLVLFVIITIQAYIRGAELSLLAVMGPILALNITSNNRNLWSSYFKQVVIVAFTQGLQIFMVQAFLTVVASGSVNKEGILLISIAWLWMCIKTPQYVKQFAHSTGFSGAMGGSAKQAGSMYLMRKMMTRGA